jgi:2-dehydropantoate 2-reductase
VCIVGAGAIGGWLGAAFARAGCSVSLLARSATLAALREHGLVLLSGDRREVHGVRASEQAAELGPQDLVVVAVKGPALAAVAGQIAALLGPATIVLTAMNGVPWWFLHQFGGPLSGRRLESIDPDGRIEAAISADRVVGGVVHVSCSVDAPGVVRHGFGNRIILGQPAGGADGRSAAIAAPLAAAGIDAPVTADIQREIWFKLWGNMTVNPVSAITGADSHQILDDELVRAFCSRVMVEARSIGAHLGIHIEQQPEDRHAVTRKLGAFRTSMLQDVQAGRPVELDALVGAVRELGGLTGVATPFTDALLGIARLHARVRGLYP